MSHILRFPRIDDPIAFIIVEAQHRGPAALDLTLVGTDGSYPFSVQVEQTTVQGLRSSNYQGTDHEWTCILSALLLQQDITPAVAQNIEAVASVAENANSITLSIRKNIDGITVSCFYTCCCCPQDADYIATSWYDHVTTESRRRTRHIELGQHCLAKFRVVTCSSLTASSGRVRSAPDDSAIDCSAGRSGWRQACTRGRNADQVRRPPQLQEAENTRPTAASSTV